MVLKLKQCVDAVTDSKSDDNVTFKDLMEDHSTGQTVCSFFLRFSCTCHKAEFQDDIDKWLMANAHP